MGICQVVDLDHRSISKHGVLCPGPVRIVLWQVDNVHQDRLISTRIELYRCIMRNPDIHEITDLLLPKQIFHLSAFLSSPGTTSSSALSLGVLLELSRAAGASNQPTANNHQFVARLRHERPGRIMQLR